MTVGNVFNLGSVYVELDKLVPDIPVRLSGTASYHTIMSSINNISAYTGQDIGSTSINAKFQDAIIYKSCISILNSKNLEGSDVSDVKLGDFTVKKGSDSNSTEAIKTFNVLLKSELRVLGRKLNYYRTY